MQNSEFNRVLLLLNVILYRKITLSKKMSVISFIQMDVKSKQKLLNKIQICSNSSLVTDHYSNSSKNACFHSVIFLVYNNLFFFY